MEGTWYSKQQDSSGLLDGTPAPTRDQWVVPLAATAIVLFWAVAVWFAVGLVRALA